MEKSETKLPPQPLEKHSQRATQVQWQAGSSHVRHRSAPPAGTDNAPNSATRAMENTSLTEPSTLTAAKTFHENSETLKYYTSQSSR